MQIPCAHAPLTSRRRGCAFWCSGSAAVVAGALAIALSGCKREASPVDRVSPPELHVVSAGSEPRQLLRYHVAKGAQQKLEVAISVALTADDMGGPLPTIVTDLAYTVDAVLPTGQLTLRGTIDRVSARDTSASKVPAAALAGPLEPLTGMTVHSVLSPDGQVTGSRVDPGGKALSPELSQQMTQLLATFESTMMRLPHVPVGPGAVWRSSRPVEQNGLRLTAVNTVALVAITGDLIEYTVETQIHGADQRVEQDGTTIDVTDLVGSGAGKGTIDLGTLAVTSEMAAQLRSTMTATGETSPTKLEMATEMTVRPL